MYRQTEVRIQNTEKRLTAETQRRREECPSTSSGRTASLPVMLSLSKHLLILCSVFIITACGGGEGGNSSTSPSYTVTYNGNTNTGGTVPVDGSSPYLSGATVTVLDNIGTLVKTGYTFAGWNTLADGSGTAYTAAATFAITGNTILYAQWTQDSSTSPSSTITFSGSSSGYNVYMAQNTSQSSGSVIAVDIMLSNVSNVYGAAFDIDLDSSKMTYSSYSAGSFLESGGNSVTYQAVTQSGNSGKVVVGISRQGAVSGNSGSGTLVTLKFNVTSGGSVSFSNSSLVDSSGNTISASWSSGGTVTVE